MVIFSITLLLLVPLSIVVIAALYARKLRKVRDRRRAVVITQYGLGSTQMLEVVHGERNGCGNMMVKIIILLMIVLLSSHSMMTLLSYHPTIIYSNSLMILCMPLLKTPSPSHWVKTNIYPHLQPILNENQSQLHDIDLALISATSMTTLIRILRMHQ